MADVLEFLQNERGITLDTLKRFGVEADVEGGAVFPFPGGIKTRWHDDDGKRHFKTVKGAELGLFGDKDAVGTEPMFLVEGETDAMRLAQELEFKQTVLGLPGINAWKDEYAKTYFNIPETVYVILDNDDDYKVQATVDRTWLQIRKALKGKARRIKLPEGVKDLCEFFDTYDIDALRTLAEERGSHIWHYDALDLSKPAPPPDWMVDELVCKGDLTMLIGEPGVGKSWISLALAVAVAEGYTTFLGRKLDTASTRVLYVDEENPEALVRHRLKLLGLTETGQENIRYLHRQGIRLDKKPEALLDEALEWEPSLIVLDSLTRLHTKDENHAGEVAALFNDGINPLARETGATTLVLHHVNKGESNSSFSRARGSGDISASIDSGLDIRPSDTSGGINIAHYKSRWILEGAVIRAQIADTPDGNVTIIVNNKSAF